MSLVMLRRAITAQRRTMLSYASSVFFYGLLIALLYPTVRAKMKLVNGYVHALPKPLVKAFGLQDYSTYPHFMGSEFLNLIFPIIASVFVILAFSSVVAQEVEQGTVDLWLSVPASRARLLGAKLAALALSVIALAVATDLAIALGARITGQPVSLGGLAALTVALVLLPLTVGSVAAFFSSLTSTRGHATALAAAALVLSYLVWVVSLLSDRFSWLEHLSVFSAYHPQDALSGGAIELSSVLALVAIAVVGMSAALLAFQRRATL